MALSGAKMTSGNMNSLINVENFSNLFIPKQANTIHSPFLEPLDTYRLQEPLARLPLKDELEFLGVTEEHVLKVLCNLQA